MTARAAPTLTQQRRWIAELVGHVNGLIEGDPEDLATLTFERSDLVVMAEIYALLHSLPDSDDPLRILIQPTTDFVEHEGRRLRRWQGVSVGGTRADVFVALLRVRADQDNDPFVRELVEVPGPDVAHALTQLDALQAAMGGPAPGTLEREEAPTASD